jgi:hypothetical protein
VSEELPTASFSIKRELVLREVTEYDLAAIDAMSDVLRERINARIQIITEAPMTRVPAWRPEPVTYGPPRPSRIALCPLQIAPFRVVDGA